MARKRLHWLPFILLCPLLFSAQQQGYDILIKGGRVLDGAGNPWFAADVAITGDRIVRIGRFEATAKRVIDATGLYVAPGFIDMMDQSAVVLRRDGKAQSKIRQGVTTCIAGEGGTPGPADQLDQFFDLLVLQGISVNFGTFVSAAQARMAVLGNANRDPGAEELEKMKAVIEAAMQRGALGMTTALIYAPGSYAKTPELIELAKVAARHGGIYATHVRDEGAGVLEGIREAIEIGDTAGIPVEIYHLKVAHQKYWNKTMPKINELVMAARARGIELMGMDCVTSARRGKEAYFSAAADRRSLCPTNRNASKTCRMPRFCGPGHEDARLLRTISGRYDQARAAAY